MKILITHDVIINIDKIIIKECLKTVNIDHSRLKKSVKIIIF